MQHGSSVLTTRSSITKRGAVAAAPSVAGATGDDRLTVRIKILVAVDQALLRRALSGQLAREPDLAVVAESGSAEDAITEVRRCSPDVILLEIDMPGLCSFEAVRRVFSIRPDTKILLLSESVHDWYIDRALALKVSGYLTKRDPPEILAAAIREAVAGRTYFSEQVRSRMVVGRKGLTLTSARTSRLSLLTKREVEVLRYIAVGLTQKRTASTMNVSFKTVDNHCTNLMRKLDIHDRVELTRFAIREGLARA